MHSETVTNNHQTGPSIAIAGAGLIGLCCAWSLVRLGAQVHVFDKGQPGAGASRAAAGMLAPAFEAAAEGSHPGLLALCLAARSLWPQFAREVEAETGIATGLDARPTLVAARDVSQLHALQRLSQALEDHNLPALSLDGDAIAAIEPALNPGCAGGLLLESDGQVDNRAVIAALLSALHRRGVPVHTGLDIAQIERSGEGFLLPGGGRVDVLVDATGWQAPGMRPVRGVALALERSPALPSRVVRFGHRYLVPKRDRLILGATVEPGVSHLRADGPSVMALLDAGESICPAIASARLIERWAGVRPASADSAPVIGWTAARRYIAGGHYRNGVLLAPLTGEIVARHILTGERSAMAAGFDPSRRSLHA